MNLNARGLVNVQVRHSAAIIICLQRRVPAPAPERLASCTFSLTFAAAEAPVEETRTVALTVAEDYYWALFFAPNVTLRPEEPVTLLISAVECAQDQVWSGQQCVTPLRLAQGTPVPVVAASGSEPLLVLAVPPLTGSFKLTADPPSLLLFALAALAPMSEGAGSNGTLTVMAPRPTEWYVGVRGGEGSVNGSVNGSVSVTLVDCSETPLEQGPACGLNVTAADTTLTALEFTEPQGVVYYFHVLVTDTAPLFVRALADPPTAPLTLWASYGQLPWTSEQADVAGCTQSECYAPSIQLPNGTLPAGSNASWYVAVRCEANATAAVWFDSICAPSCNDHGNCEETGEQEGLCLCLVDYSGVDCSLPENTVGAQYIVLIIIASLVVASALIGFLAWVYMRRRRSSQYDTLSG